MKKKLLTILVITATILTLSACDDTKKSGLTTSTTTTTTADSTESTTAKASESDCKEEALDINKNWAVTFTTSMGDFTVTLDPKNSPIGSAHLASLVKEGFYDGLTFHRIIKGFVIQGGDPNGDGSGSSECTVVSEEPSREYKKGDFAWAKTSAAPIGSAGSQFFIVTDDSAAGALTNQYGSAGTVTSGMDVVTAIENVTTGAGDAPLEKVTITKATLSES